MLSNKLNYKLINFTALMFLLYISFSNVNIILKSIATIFSVLLPFIVAFSFAYALFPIKSYLTNKGISNLFSSIIVIISLGIIVFIIFKLTLPLIYEQLSTFSSNIIEISTTIIKKYNIDFSTFKITNNLNIIINTIEKIITSGIINYISKSISFLGKIVISAISFVYFLIEMENIRNTIKKTTKFISTKFYNYIKHLDLEIKNYIKGLSLIILIQSIEYSFLFFVIGHPNWLILGILAGITTIIPYVGGALTNILAILIAYTTSKSILIRTLVVCIIFPQLDGYVITPKIYGKTNNINPLISIIIIFIGTKIGGIIGIIIAIPIYIIIQSTYSFYKKDIRYNIEQLKEFTN